jgi:hypothetical protein
MADTTDRSRGFWLVGVVSVVRAIADKIANYAAVAVADVNDLMKCMA